MKVDGHLPSPGTPGERNGEGLSPERLISRERPARENPHPNPLPEYREKEKSANVSFILSASAALAASGTFLGLYCLTNWLASLRANVGTWQFAWEHRIPFVRWMIIPYLSIDLLFVLSFFVCTTRHELWVHFKRIVAVNVIAAVFFVLFPLRMDAHRPTDLSGLLGPLFRLLYSLDRPYNLCPSLHIAQGLLVWLVFNRHTRGALRLLVHAWFVTIGVSTLLTWQHGVPDILTGWLLGMLCWWMFPGDARPLSEHATQRNASVGWRWVIGGALLVVWGYLLRPWGWLLTWPAFTCFVIATGYFLGSSHLFRKVDGRLAVATSWVMFPYLLADRAARSYLLRPSKPWVRAAPRVVIGRRLNNRQARRLVAEERIMAVLDLTAECSECAELLRFPYRNIPVLDLTVPTRRQFDEALAFIREHASRGTVYVHCALGYSRAASVVIGYFVSEGIAPDVETATEMLRRLRPQIALNGQYPEGLRRCFSATDAPVAGS
jgi:predicted protein tyrosine phosphatase